MRNEILRELQAEYEQQRMRDEQENQRRRDQAEHPALGRLPIRLPDFKLGICPPGLQGRSQPEQQRRHH